MRLLVRPRSLFRQTAVAAGLLLVVLTPIAAGAQERSPVPAPFVDEQGAVRQGARPALPREPFLRGYFMTDVVSMAAADTFDAVVGTSRLTMRGGGGEVLNIWRGLFARAAFSAGEEEGTRVVVFDDEVIPLDIPLTVEIQPLEIGGGWRFRPLAGGHLVPYVGAAFLRVGYRERSEFGTADDDVDTSVSGRTFFGGIEAVVGGWVIAGAEVQYRSVPDALGDGGASEVFGERDLGGTVFRVLIGIRR